MQLGELYRHLNSRFASLLRNSISSAFAMFRTFPALCLLLALPALASAADIRLVRSLSGPSGKTAGNTFVFDEVRNRFVYPRDNSLTVFFEWETDPGLHVLTGIWKSPDGRTASISPDVKIETTGKPISCYWIFSLTPGMANGFWTLEVRMDGQPAGSHPFEIAGMPEPGPEPVLTPAPKQPTTDEIYKAVNPSLVWVHKLDSSGHRLDTSTGFIFGHDLIATSFQSIDSATKLELEFAGGRKILIDSVPLWSRTGDWALLTAATGDLPAVPAGDPVKVAVGERLLAFAFESNTRIFGGVDISGRVSVAGYGERIQFSPALDPHAAGGPLLDLNGKVVGILGGATAQGGHYGSRTMNLAPSLWNAIQPDNAATPISSVPDRVPGPGKKLEELMADGTLTPPIAPTEDFGYGGTVINLPKNAGDPLGRDMSEFSVHDPQVYVYSYWTRHGKLSKADIGARIYDAANKLRINVTPKKFPLESVPARIAFSFPPSSLAPGVYRIDITYNGNAAWRTFVRISE
jgi:hypothetical protein